MPCRSCTPFYHCDVGDQLWLAELAAQTAYDKAQRDLTLALSEHIDDLRPLEDRLRGAAGIFRGARAAYNQHMGLGTIIPARDLAFERVLGPTACQASPAECASIVEELKRLYQAAGESIPAMLLSTMTPAPVYVQMTTPPPLYTGGAPQESEFAE